MAEAFRDTLTTLDEVLGGVLDLQPKWTKDNTPEMQKRGSLIRHQGPRVVSRLLGERLGEPPFDLGVEGRDGTGLKTRIPWIRVYSKARSPSATEGWYVVYLFALDGSAVYLSLNQGTTVPEGGQFKMRPPEELKARATWARTVVGASESSLLQEFDLADPGDLALGYERGNVLARPYRRDSIPVETGLADDLAHMVGLLAKLYDAPGEPSYSHHAQASVSTAKPSLADEPAFVARMRDDYGATLAPSRKSAEQEARELLDAHAGHMTRDQALHLGELFNSGEWGGVLRRNRFTPAFVGATMARLVDPLDAFNDATERLWRRPIEEALALANDILLSPTVLPGAGRSYPTMLLYLRDPSKFVIWLQITHQGLVALGRLEEAKGRTGGVERYLKYCEAALQFARDYGLDVQEIDAILAAAARAASRENMSGAAEIASLVDDAVTEGEIVEPSGTEYPLLQVAALTHLPIERLEEWVGLLRGAKKQALFYGPPGTGKTFVAQQLARHLAGSEGEVEMVQFHPSFSYEDFIEGLRPVLANGTGDGGSATPATSITYDVRPGVFLRFCERARGSKGNFVFIIDEINRAELGAVLGELMMLLEYRGKTLQLPYSQRQFSVPENVILLATMNTADRSLALVDFALRRRFHALEMLPDRTVLEQYLGADGELALDFFDAVQRQVNNNDFAPGHSYWMNDDVTAQGLYRVWRYELYPYLAEYWFEHRARLDELDARVAKLLAEET